MGRIGKRAYKLGVQGMGGDVGIWIVGRVQLDECSIHAGCGIKIYSMGAYKIGRV
jgi:hypothetical protein